jgi:hypothetical protein
MHSRPGVLEFSQHGCVGLLSPCFASFGDVHRRGYFGT